MKLPKKCCINLFFIIFLIEQKLKIESNLTTLYYSNGNFFLDLDFLNN